MVDISDNTSTASIGHEVTADEDDYVIIHTTNVSSQNLSNKQANNGKDRKNHSKYEGIGTGESRQSRRRKAGKTKSRKKKVMGNARNDEDSNNSSPNTNKKSGMKYRKQKLNKKRRGRNRKDRSSSGDSDDVGVPLDQQNHGNVHQSDHGRNKKKKFYSRHAVRNLLKNSAILNGFKDAVDFAGSATELMYNAAARLYEQRCGQLQTKVFKATATDTKRIRKDVESNFASKWVALASSVAGIEIVSRCFDRSNTHQQKLLQSMLVCCSLGRQTFCLLLCSIAFQCLDSNQIPSHIVNIECCNNLSFEEIKLLCKALKHECPHIVEILLNILRDSNVNTDHKIKNKAYCTKYMTTVGLEEIVNIIHDNNNLFVKFPKTSGKAIKHFVFKQRDVLHSALRNVLLQADQGIRDSKPDENKSGQSASVALQFLSLSSQLMLLYSQNAYVQLQWNGNGVEEKLLFENLLNISILSNKNTEKNEDDGVKTELIKLMKSVYDHECSNTEHDIGSCLHNILRLSQEAF